MSLIKVYEKAVVWKNTWQKVKSAYLSELGEDTYKQDMAKIQHSIKENIDSKEVDYLDGTLDILEKGNFANEVISLIACAGFELHLGNDFTTHPS